MKFAIEWAIKFPLRRLGGPVAPPIFMDLRITQLSRYPAGGRGDRRGGPCLTDQRRDRRAIALNPFRPLFPYFLYRHEITYF